MQEVRNHPGGLAVEAIGLVKTFETVRAVDGIDLQVRQGQVLGVLGPNGAGKTTMLKMLATLLPIDGGTARIFGVDVAANPHQVRQLVGVTGQYASVDENLTGWENLVLFGRLLGLSRAQARSTADELLSSFGLTAAAGRRIKAFSGGMRRRLDLAASLIRRPPLIFLDEPTTGLDPRTRGQMWDTIRALVRDGATVLLTTQYLDEADQLADRIAVIDRGAKVAEGTPDELKTSVGNSTLHVRLEDRERTAEAAALVARVIGEEPVLTPEAGGLNIALADANAAADVLIALREAKLGISSASVRQPTLDEVFLALTGHHSDRDDAGPLGRCADGDLVGGDRRGATPRRASHDARHPSADPGHGVAGAAQDAAQPGAVLRRHVTTPAVHRDVHLHLRWRRRRQRAELSADHHSRHSRADDADRVYGDWHPAARGHGQGRLRSLQIAADRAHRAARGPGHRGPAALRGRGDAHDPGRSSRWATGRAAASAACWPAGY